MAYTEEDCMGGRAWTTLSDFAPGVGEATTLFLNSTYGMIIRIGYGQFSGQGGAVLGVGAIDGHPVPDFCNRHSRGRESSRDRNRPV